MPAIDPPRASAQMTDAQLDQLGELLHTRALPHGGLTLEALDGFYSALAVSPEPLPPEQFHHIVWGEDHQWDSEAQADEAHGLTAALWREIEKRVAKDPDVSGEAAFPLLAMPDGLMEQDPDQPFESDFPVGAEWAAGFLMAVSLQPEAWDERLSDSDELVQDFADLQRLLDDESDEAPDHLLAQAPDADASEGPGEAAASAPGDDAIDLDSEHDGDAALDFDARMEILGQIPYMLYDLHVWKIEDMAPREPVRREDGPGRNDPCPCGSGQKFKKCCGDPARLH